MITVPTNHTVYGRTGHPFRPVLAGDAARYPRGPQGFSMPLLHSHRLLSREIGARLFRRTAAAFTAYARTVVSISRISMFRTAALLGAGATKAGQRVSLLSPIRPAGPKTREGLRHERR